MTLSKTPIHLAICCLVMLLAACGGSDDKSETASSLSSSSGGQSSITGVSSSAPASANSSSSASLAAARIKLNQLGFLPNARKIAAVPAGQATRFTIVAAGTDTEVLSGDLGSAAEWLPAKESVQLADFSELTAVGEYQLRVAGLEDSASFKIAPDAYQALNAAAVKAFYFNRASTALLATHAGIYARAAGHPDTNVQVHISAASVARPAATVISAPKGWYDAGDYNKYIVNSGISTYMLLAAYEHFPQHYQAQNLNIPESGNGLADLLDEALWNLEWMLSMQDPNDGGVYHKLTDKLFDGIIMPHQANTQRYVVQKSTSAALNFAAVMAAASRIFAEHESQFPGLSVRMLSAAESAWGWAQANPATVYTQPTDIKTGEYGDANLADEQAWAAAELYITTRNDAYYTAMNPAQVYVTVPSWGDVRSLAWMSLAHHRSELTAIADTALIAQRIDGFASSLLDQWQASAYAVPMNSGNFVWGSNSVALGQAVMLLQAYQLNDNNDYLHVAQSLLDYVLGRNPTDFSFVTGFGWKTPQNIHHRPSEADGIEAPIPGFIAGGPQNGQQDAAACPVSYPSNEPAKSYLDHWCSYASNEIAINWNAPLVYVSGAIQVLTGQ